jgi:esterase/lipase superfamily enzyme
MKTHSRWYSERLRQDTQLVRWGTVGLPCLLFPTAGGDAEELERCGVIDCLAPLLADCRLKIYSIDNIAGRTWIQPNAAPGHRVWVQSQFDAYVYYEVVPAIRADCRSADIGVITGGASLGAFHALASICRHPDVFTRAICLSGTYNLEPWLYGKWYDDFYFTSPWHYLPGLSDSWQLSLLRQRWILLALGGGRWEDAGQTWHMAHLLGEKKIPNRVDVWDSCWDHDWPTWRAMLPLYVEEMLRSLGN